MKKLSTILCVVWLLVIVPSSFSNNISVSNVSLEGQVVMDHYCLVEFDLSWDNSWRTTSVPQNWDAAWVFVKYSVAGGPWFHAKIDPAGSVQPAGCTLEFADTTGVFIYRDADGSGTFAVTDIGIRWSYGDQGVPDDASVEVKVFAIEMVYVPQGSFNLGDGTSLFRFYGVPDNTSSYQVVSEASISVHSSTGDLWATGAIGTGTVPAEYPKGFNAFYCMKYEISQEQYIDFLNSLTRDQQDERVYSDISGTNPTETFVMNSTIVSGMVRRNGIRCAATLPASGPIEVFADFDADGTGNETTDGQNIACNFLSWPDVAAYLDWSGLRAMTELEFEKACRGPNNAVGGEYAWGNTLLGTVYYNLSNSGEANEQVSNIQENIGNCVNSGTYPNIGGPLRCGGFAASSVNHTRIETGATYYGIMEMSGNVVEFVVTNYGLAGRSYTGKHGDGFLTVEGDANVDHWPGIGGNDSHSTANPVYTTIGVTGFGGLDERGGSFSTSYLYNTISRRSTNGIYTNSDQDFGSRGVRTAP